MSSVLKASNINFTYPNGPDLSFPDLDFGESEKRLIIGKSGSGKTTLLNILSGILAPSKGEVILSNTNLYQQKQSDLDKFRGKKVGIVFQTAQFIGALNVIQNLLICQKLGGEKQDKTEIRTLLKQLGISQYENSRIKDLSVGEKQRVGIARALLNKPEIIFADEPTSALDDDHCWEVLDLLEKQSADHRATLVIVTHDSRIKDRFTNKIELSKS